MAMLIEKHELPGPIPSLLRTFSEGAAKHRSITMGVLARNCSVASGASKAEGMICEI